MTNNNDSVQASRPRNFRRWMLVIGVVILAVTLVDGSDRFLTKRLSQAQHNEAQLLAAWHSGGVTSLLQQQSLVPLLLAYDPVFTSALQSKDYTNTSRRLIEIAKETGSASIFLIDIDGRIVAASDRRDIGATQSDRLYYTAALRENGTVFTVATEQAADFALPGFHYARKIQTGTTTVGIVVVAVNMRQLEESWRRRGTQIAVTNSEDKIILSSNPAWQQNTLSGLLADEPGPGFFAKLLGRPEYRSGPGSPYVFLGGEPLLRSEVRIGFRGWRLYHFAPLDDLRARVNAVLALEIMGMAILAAMAFFQISRRAQRHSLAIARESDALRSLNQRLSQEVEERQKVEKTLQEVEQSLEQASKLAALGQMSAAVSHELNQPLAAMRTYLAGARLLLKRKRPDEAALSFERIDDLIERMSTITRQLKSYARKGRDNMIAVDIRDAVHGSLAMMAPQLGHTKVDLRKNLPAEPVMVDADPVRLDQVIVNLLRNALDAIADEPAPMIDILLVQGRHVSLSIRDNGHGFENPEQLFEPFYTTKRPGEGVGLGLAISAGIAAELGGRLSARRADPQGAIFELVLPRAGAASSRAAE